jgi:hypothetical protein
METARAPDPTSNANITPQDVSRELEILWKSPQFARAEKQRALLQYLCEKWADGKCEGLKESVIAAEVFHRTSDYAAGDGSIVRVQIYELRRRLREYYAEAGRTRLLRIEIPRGSYCPQIIRAVDLEAAGAAVVTPTQARALALPRYFLLVLLGALLGVSLCFNAWLALRLRSPTTASASTEAAASENRDYLDLLSPPEARARGTLLCLSNPSVLFLDGTKVPMPAGVIANRALPLAPDLTRALRTESRYNYLFSAPDNYTGMGEAVSAYQLGLLLQKLNVRTTLTQARFLSWDRASQDNVIVLGQAHSNPWTREHASPRLFEDTDEGLRLFPGSGQVDRNVYPTTYDPKTGQVISDYGVISRETTGSGTSMLMLAGRSSFGTYGVGQFFCDPQKMSAVFRSLRAPGSRAALPKNFVVLLKIDVNEDIPVRVEYVKAQIQTH